jgi:hypothetical protein
MHGRQLLREGFLPAWRKREGHCGGISRHEPSYVGSLTLFSPADPRCHTGGLQIQGEDDAYDFGSGAGFYVDATKEPWTKGYNMYSYITKELPETLFKEFKELDGSRVSITGHSMGGHGALTLVSVCQIVANTQLTRRAVPQESWPIQVCLRIRAHCEPDQLPLGTKGFQRLLWRGPARKVEAARRDRAR